tara:strand:- start:172 stop:993 length:822 start_codon:yes stop_codon:yes gene_type:complete
MLDIRKNYIHIIGSEGFIGKNIKKIACQFSPIYWSHTSKENYFNIFERNSWQKLLDMNPHKIIFLSWPGLPNYDSDLHIKENLPAMVDFFEILFKRNIERVVIVGTCYEYGNESGMLSEDLEVYPLNNYAIAKNLLRKSIQKLSEKSKTSWAWTRLFYPYGEGQNENSLIPSLLSAIKNQEEIFEIGSPYQKRDFIHVLEVVKYLLFLVNNNDCVGIFNIGSGKPTSVFEIVQKIILEKKSKIKIVYNPYKNRKNESQEFWANMTKLKKFTNM